MSTAPPPEGYYPEQAYYAPGWQAPVPQRPAVPPPRRRGARVALTVGLVLLLVGVLVVAGLGARLLLERRPLGPVDGPRTAHVGQLRAGHCLVALPDDGEVGRVEVVPCTETHEAEVIGLLTIPGDTWPGQDQVDRRVGQWCEMDTAQRDAGFAAAVWAPSERGWRQGDRSGVCLAVAPQGGAVGSFTDGDEVTVG